MGLISHIYEHQLYTAYIYIHVGTYVYLYQLPASILYVFQISLGKIMHPNTERTSSLLTDLLLIREGELRPVNGLPYSSRPSGPVCRNRRPYDREVEEYAVQSRTKQIKV